MTTIELLARIAVSWLVISVIVVGAYAVAVALHKSRMQRTVRITGAYPAVVPVRPRITQADVDACWLDAWPTDVEPADIDTLEQRVYDRLFDDLIAIEGLQ